MTPQNNIKRIDLQSRSSSPTDYKNSRVFTVVVKLLRQSAFLLLALSAGGLIFVSAAKAQTGNIAYPENAIDSRLRSPLRIDPVSQGLQFQITLGSYPGRGGADLPVTIFYSSKLWRMSHLSTVGGPGAGGVIYPQDSIYGANYAETSASGWTSNLDWSLFPAADNPVETFNSQGQPAGGSGTYRLARIFVKLPDGSRHEMRRDDNIYPAATFNGSGTYYSVDGSRLRYETSSGTLYLPDGSRYAGDKFIDPHGNELTHSGYQLTDTLGRSIGSPLPGFTTVGESANAVVRDESYSLPGVNGSPVGYTFRWKRLGDVLTDPTQALRSKGPRISKNHCQTVDSLFDSPDYCGAGGDEDHRLMQTALFNPVVLSEIVFPDGSNYKFTYNIYGEIDKVVYPAGSYERFQHTAAPSLSGYFNVHFGDFYAQGNRGVYNRYISADGTGADEILWSYAGGQAGTYPNNVPTRRVTAPDGSYTESRLHAVKSSDLIKFGFDDPRTGMAFDERSYSSTATGNYLLSRRLTEWQTDGQVIYEGSFQTHKTRNPRPAKQVAIVFDETGNALATTTTYQYDGDLNTTAVKRYGYTAVDSYTAQNGAIASIPSGTLSRTEETDYLTYDQNYRNRNMLSLPVATRIRNAADAIVAESEIHYDETSYPLLSCGAAVGYGDPATNVRGLVTTTKSRLDTTNSWIETHAQYDGCGNVRKMWDGRGNMSEIQYADNFADNVNRNSYAYPTKTISAVPGGNGSQAAFETTVKYDFSTGLVISATDANGQSSQIEYNDPLLRPTRTIAPNGHQTITQYGAGTSAATRFVKIKTQIDDTKWSEGYAWYDGLGRTYKTQSVDADGDVFALTCYDQYGRLEKASNPFRNVANPTCSTALEWTANTYDGAGRVWKVTTPDGAVVETNYGLAATGTNIGTTVTVKDQALKERRSITNALGQLTRVDEPTASGLGTIDAPNQATFYSYDTLNNLTMVNQGGQTRSFAYDSLSRLKSATNPELGTTPTNGTISYFYDNNGNLTSKTDPRGVQTSYVYDALNRVITRSYANEPAGQATTPTVNYFYDNLPNAKGKLIKVSSSVSTTEYTVFDEMGRVKNHRQTTDGQIYDTGYTYNLSGALIEETYPSGRVVKNVLDNDGALSMVQSKKNANSGYFNYAKNFTYTAAGAVSSMQLGNGKWESTQFNSRLQPTQIALGTVQGGFDKLNLIFDYGTTQNNGNVQSQTITVPTTGSTPGFTAVQTYSYDELNRLKSAEEKISNVTSWKQTYTFDRYGNRRFDEANTDTIEAGCPTAVCNPTIDPNTNKLVGYTFDTAGNTQVDASGKTFTYDAENKQTLVKNASNIVVGEYFYDGDGKRVKKIAGGEETIFIYDAAGKLVAEYTNQMSDDSQISYLTNDHLGSPRITTDADGKVFSRRDFLPFGEEIDSTDTLQRNVGLNYGEDGIRQKFTGYEKDEETDLDFAQARYYNKQHGRFNSVDPIMMKKSRMIDPQQINLYIYVRNNPFKFVDVSGNDLIPANTKSARQLQNDLAKRLSKAELANLRIVAGKNIVIINSQLQSNSTAYQQVIQAVTSNKITTYFSAPQGSSVTVNRPGGNITIPWSSSGCVSLPCATVDAGATVPIDTNDIRTANSVNVYVPDSGSVSSVLGDNGQGQVAMTRDLLTLHEIGHSNCGPGQCAVNIENDIRGEQIPPLPTRGGQDHESIPTDAVQPNSIQIDAPPGQIISIPDTQIQTNIEFRKIEPITIPLQRSPN